MKPPRFAYADPSTVDEAVALKREHGEDATVLAGGQSLVPMLNMRLASPEMLIDINGVADLQQVRKHDGALEFGAGVRQHVLERNADVRGAVPLLALAAPHIGHVENRHRGTIGGSIAHADSAAELPCVAVALGAEIVIAGPDGVRAEAADAFFQGWMTTTVGADELVTAVRFPVAQAREGHGFAEVARRHGDFAIALAGSSLRLAADGTVEAVAVALGGVASQPLRVHDVEAALIGQQPEDDAIRSAAEAAAGLVTAGDDMHATRTYRQQVAKVVVRRSLAAARDRAKEASND